jgi:hypothetical protein
MTLQFLDLLFEFDDHAADFIKSGTNSLDHFLDGLKLLFRGHIFPRFHHVPRSSCLPVVPPVPEALRYTHALGAEKRLPPPDTNATAVMVAWTEKLPHDRW